MTGAAVRDPTRRTALVGGALYLVTFAASIPAVFLLAPVLDDPAAYVTGSGADAQVSLGALLDLVNALACIGTAVVLFSVVKLEHEGLALGFVTSRMFEAAVIVIGVVSILAIVTLRQDGAASGEAASFVPVARGLVAVRDWTFVLGPGMAGLNALLLGTLLYRSRLVPRPIPTIGLVGGPIYLSSVAAIVVGLTQPGGIWQGVGGLFMFAWELLLGLWLVFRGFDRSAPIVADAIAREGAGSR
ncbi:MAG TPA: DUF4386 domain-containing protein [Candidatus Limnocylindrales bacterium]